jgi:hypothetical protein
LFRLDEKRARALFSGRESVIKANLSKEMAMTYLIRMAEAGCESCVQEMFDSDTPEFEEKRADFERRQRYRRQPRAGAIVPDRRLELRRSYDIRQFRDVVNRGSSMPLPYQSYAPLDDTQ